MRKLFYKIFIYILIYSHLSWSNSVMAGSSGLKVERGQDDLQHTYLTRKLSSLPKLEKQKVELTQGDDGTFHIGFDQKETSFIGVDYFNSGFLIARSLIHDSQVIFEGYSGHNFTLDTPLRASQLHCKSNGRLRFLSDVSVLKLKV
jgi:hypothetical protein